jgi:hypothetical protein
MSDLYHTLTRTRSHAHAHELGTSGPMTRNFDDFDAVIIPADPSRRLPRPLQNATNYIINTNTNETYTVNEIIGQRASRLSPMAFTHEWLMSPDRERELEDTPSPPLPPLLPSREVIECVRCHDLFDTGGVRSGSPEQEYMWQLRCGHMLDPKCLNELGQPRAMRMSSLFSFAS